MSEQDYRVEQDSMGEVRVPADAKWRAPTQRAVENFPISGQRIERAHIEALARIKGAAAKGNARLGGLAKDIAEAIHEAAEGGARGDWDEHFPPASPSCPSGGRRSAPASTPRPASPPPSSRRSPASRASRSPRRATTSRRRARGTGSSRRAVSSGPSPSG